MELNQEAQKVALNWDAGRTNFPVKRKRQTVGSGKTCDIILPVKTISSIHAVIEYHPDHLLIFDMNSTNGTFFGGKRVVTAKIKLGESFYLADQKITFNQAINDGPPPILNMLASPPAKAPPMVPATSQSMNHRSKSMAGEFPQLVQYPLASDPKALYSEYIFEDVDLLHPIFRYETDFHAVEVVILFKDKIISADYLPIRNASYFLVGSGDADKTLEFAYLPRHEKQLFIDVRSQSVAVYPLEGFQTQFISDNHAAQISGSSKQGNNGPIDLAKDDIISFSKGPLSVFIRQTDAPPKVKAAPLFELDHDFKRYLFLVMLITCLFAVGVAVFPLQNIKEKEDEKAPDLVVRILHKRPAATKAIAKTESKPLTEIQKAPVVKEVIKEPDAAESPKQMEKQDKKINPVKSGKKDAPESQAKLGSPKQAKVEKKIDKVADSSKTNHDNLASTAAKRVQVSATPAVTKGPVDTFKSIDFSSSLSSVLSKGGQASKVKSVDANASAVDIGGGTVIGGATESATVKTATLQEKVGSLSGVASGTLDTSKGLEGVVSKRTVVTAGIPDKIVVMGGMDPDTIDKILRDHLPQFRYCYQKVLDRSSAEFEGRFTMNFIIGASGHVSRIAIVKSNLTDNVSACVENVVRGIQFPEPRGGGTVEVNKPLNFVVKNQ